jgi:hypothetical protein
LPTTSKSWFANGKVKSALLERDVHEGFDGADAAARRDHGEGILVRQVVSGGAVALGQQVEVLEQRFAHRALLRVLDQLRALLGRPEGGEALLERNQLEQPPGAAREIPRRQVHQPEQHAHRAHLRLRQDLRAARVRLLDVAEHAAPEVRELAGLEHAEGERPAVAPAHPLHPVHLGQDHVRLGAVQVGHRLEDAAPLLAEHVSDSDQLVRRREGARNRLAVRRLVQHRAGSREAERAAADRLAHDLAHA